MKNFNQFILTLLAAGLFASCSLTEEPTSFVNRKSFYKNESQCIAALNSCYMPANAIYTANFMLVTEACTDIWYSSSTTVDACLDVTPAKPQYGKNVWTQGYKGVMYCNECVECISSADLADGVKMPLAAEARVMRAFYYYVLTCMFGDVPFYTTMVDTDQRLAEIRRLPRTPAHEIRQELYDDLERNALPWFTAENGRKCRASEAVDNRSGYALALTGWTAGGTLLRPQRVRVECREVEPWENRLERQNPAETEDFLRRGAQEQGTFALEDLAQDAPG